MGTANFYSKNATHIFAAELADEWAWNDLCTNLQMSLSDLADKGYRYFDEDGNHKEQGKIVSEIHTETKSFGGIEFSLRLEVVVRSGYYAGANLDWELYVDHSHDCEEWDEVEVDEIFEEAYPETDCPEEQELIETNVPLAESWLQQEKDKLVTEVEKIFRWYATPLGVVGRGSNGVAFYEKAEPDNEE